MFRRLLLGSSALFLAVFAYEGAVRALLRPWLDLPVITGGLHGRTMVLVLFSLTHALYTLGGHHTLAFFGLSAVISWVYEHVGVATGLVYGAYHYTDVLGPKIGHVPLLIPLAWFMMLYPSYVIADLIVQGQPTGTARGLGRLLSLSFLSALVMTAWDLLIDPILSGPDVQAWVWEEPGPYFGIPVQNYVGWMLTTFTVYGAYRLFEQRAGPRPAGEVTALIASMPLVAYGCMMITNSSASSLPALAVIGPFVMGPPLVAAVLRLRRTPLTPGSPSEGCSSSS